MSWQAYTDNLLASKTVTKAALLGHDGSTWAVSGGLNVDKTEGTKLVQNIKAKEPTDLYASGILVGKTKYTFLRHETGRSVYGRKGGDSGIVVVLTKQALLIGVYEGGLQPGNAAAAVEKLADYLIGLNY